MKNEIVYGYALSSVANITKIKVVIFKLNIKA